MTTTIENDLEAGPAESLYPVDPRLCRDPVDPFRPIDSPTHTTSPTRLVACKKGEGGPCWRCNPIAHVIDGVKGLRADLTAALDGFDQLTVDLRFALGGVHEYQSRNHSISQLERASSPEELQAALGSPSLGELHPDARNAVRLKASGLQQDFIAKRIEPLLAKLEAGWAKALPTMRTEAEKVEEAASAEVAKRLGYALECRPLSDVVRTADESLRYYTAYFRQHVATAHPRSSTLTVHPVRRLLD